MADIKIIHDEQREKSSRGRKAWTLDVDGQPSMLWCPTEFAVKRAAARLHHVGDQLQVDADRGDDAHVSPLI